MDYGTTRDSSSLPHSINSINRSINLSFPPCIQQPPVNLEEEERQRGILIMEIINARTNPGSWDHSCFSGQDASDESTAAVQPETNESAIFDRPGGGSFPEYPNDPKILDTARSEASLGLGPFAATIRPKRSS